MTANTAESAGAIPAPAPISPWLDAVNKWRPIVLALLVGGGVGGFGNNAISQPPIVAAPDNKALSALVTELDKTVAVLVERVDALTAQVKVCRVRP